MRLRALVVDDEPAARTGLAAMVRQDLDIVDVRECGDRDSAVRALRLDPPDVVLLDVQLNPGTGFEVIDQVGATAMPHVIFVTAFEHHAVKAFEAAAIDYLLKPVEPDRLRAALQRVKGRMASSRESGSGERLMAAVASLRGAATRPIAFAEGERTLVFEPQEIGWIEAADYYAKVHARGRSCLVRESLDSLEQRLACPPFFRVHRSAIVNVRHVVEVSRVSRHRHVAVLRDGARVPVSAERRGALDEWLLAGPGG